MSLNEAAPVARHGLPKKPCKKRMTRNPEKLCTVADATRKIRYMANVMIYIGFRPMSGISLRGEKTRGPRPSNRGESALCGCHGDHRLTTKNV